MKYVIFSDVHGNADALRLMLEQEKDFGGQYIFCGDVAGYYYASLECVSLLESLPGLTAVRGNHDKYFIDSFHDNGMTDKLSKRYGSSYREKDGSVLDYLGRLPLHSVWKDGKWTVKVQHGSPFDFYHGRIYPDGEFVPPHPDTIYICGHTHYRLFRNMGKSVLLNPGSLGQPRDSRGFSYCILETEPLLVTFKKVAYDCGRLIDEAKEFDPENKYLIDVLRRNGSQ